MKRTPIEDLDSDPAVREALARLLREAEAQAPGRIQRAILYGSVARGHEREDSDVDLLVVWRGDVTEALHVLVGITTTILLEVGVDISVHPVRPEDLERLEQMRTGFYENLEREGLVVA